MSKLISAVIIFLLGISLSSLAQAHANACHRVYVNKQDTIEFYEKSFKASEILHMHLLKERMAADHYLELGVLEDIKGKPAERYLNKALASLKKSRKEMDNLYSQIGLLRKHDKEHKPLPDHIKALDRILKSQPPIERVSLTHSRFANLSQYEKAVTNLGPIGNDFDDMLSNLQSDLKMLSLATDETIAAFVSAMPLAKNGGFAAMVLSGRAPLPEKIMHTVDQTMIYVQFFNRACMTSIAADMLVYPKGFEWLPKVNWKKPVESINQ